MLQRSGLMNCWKASAVRIGNRPTMRVAATRGLVRCSAERIKPAVSDSHDFRGHAHNRCIFRDVMDHYGPGPDPGPCSNSYVAKYLCACTDVDVVSQGGRSSVALTYRHLVIDIAVSPQYGVGMQYDAASPMGESEPAARFHGRRKFGTNNCVDPHKVKN